MFTSRVLTFIIYIVKRLQRYVLGKFLYFLILFTLGSIFLFIVVNFFERIDRFVSNKASILSIIKFYTFQLGYIFNLMFPVAHLLALFLSLGELSAKNEILAIRAGGISLKKVFLPLLVFALFSSILDLVVAETVGYSGYNKAERVMRVEIEKRKPIFGRISGSDISFFWKNRLYFFGYINRLRNIGSRITIVEFKKDSIVRIVNARYGTFNGKFWILKDGTERRIGEEDTLIFFRKRPFPEFNITPFEFLKRRSRLIYTPAIEIKTLIDKKKKAGLDYTPELAEYLSRFAFPFACFVMVFFGIPLASSSRWRGRSTMFGVALALAFLYWGMFQGIKLAGSLGKIDPLLSAHLTNIIFLIPSFYMYIKIDG